MALHPTTSLSARVAVRLSACHRSVYDGCSLVGRRDRFRWKADKYRKAGVLFALRGSPVASCMATGAGPHDGRCRRGGADVLGRVWLAGPGFAPVHRNPRGISRLYPAIARRIQLREAVLHAVAKCMGE